MKIEQPRHLKPLYIESFRRNTQFGVRGIIILIMGLFPSAIVLGACALRLRDAQPVEAWRWLGGVGIGPLCVVALKSAPRVLAGGDRFAEFDGGRFRFGRVCFGPMYSFPPSRLIRCEIEPDDNFPEVSRLTIWFRPYRFGGFQAWTMMVEDLEEAERFRQGIENQAV